MSVLLTALVPLIADSDTGGLVGGNDRGIELVQELIMPIYENKFDRTHPVLVEFPHLIEARIEEVSPLGCPGAWLAQVVAPISDTPPFVGGNHRFEYWGITNERAHFLGSGVFVALDQEIDKRKFSEFIQEACGESLEPRFMAGQYLRLRLAGRIPMRGAEQDGHGAWRWVEQLEELPDCWRRDVSKLSPAPPFRDLGGDREGVYIACASAVVAPGHLDLGCWIFEFNHDGMLYLVVELFRNQEPFLYPGDKSRAN